MASMSDSLEITRASLADWPVIQGWCADEGWNPGHADGPCFLAQDPDGFFLGRIAGEPVSAVSVVNYGDAFSFLGLYLVKPEFRGRGHGFATWRAALPRAGSRTVGLDGVVAQQDNYRKSGFDHAYRHVRYAGTMPAGDAAGAGDSGAPGDPGGHGALGRSSASGVPAVPAVSVRPLADVAFEQITAYDERCFPAPRPVFLREWFATPGHVTRALIVDGRLAGYGVARPAHDGTRVGPLFADTAEHARTLFEALVQGIGGGPVAIDVPENNPAAVALAESLGLEPVFEVARMYTGPVREVDQARVFGVTSLELG
jgi:GNAT superfamily N-acetyltransferase